MIASSPTEVGPVLKAIVDNACEVCDAYDAAGMLLESVTIGTVPVANWGNNFFGLERSEGIRSVVFSGADFGIDGLTFEGSPVVVPEPATGVLVGLGLVVLGLARRQTPTVA